MAEFSCEKTCEGEHVFNISFNADKVCLPDKVCFKGVDISALFDDYITPAPAPGPGNVLNCLTSFVLDTTTGFDDSISGNTLAGNILTFAASPSLTVLSDAINLCITSNPGEILLFELNAQQQSGGFPSVFTPLPPDGYFTFTSSMWNPVGSIDFNNAIDLSGCDTSVLNTVLRPNTSYAALESFFGPGPFGFYFSELNCYLSAGATL